ncbi:hypothetical protein [Rhodococcus sp. HS-D2]|uniref:hypothetical protein n=1 Tax=Rhodococcus sp. HS-D2 TaxID=1384636 RepID=UPI0007D98C4E|nr:hypothetical protein [Rhodococcus sp. HS-D2]
MDDNFVDKDELLREGFRSRYIPHLLGPGIVDADGKEWWSRQLVRNTIRTVILPAFATTLMVDPQRIWGINFDTDAGQRWDAIREATEDFQWTPGTRPTASEKSAEDDEMQRADDAQIAASPLLSFLTKASGE